MEPRFLKTVMFLISCMAMLPKSGCDLTPEIEKCHAADTTCIARTINSILRRFPKGHDGIGLPSIEGLTLKDVIISEASGDSPVQLNFKLKTLTQKGVENAIITRVVGFEKDPRKSKFEVYGVIPNLEIHGDYEATGRVLLLPLNGRGKAHITLKNMKFGLKVKVSEDIKDGKRFLTITKIKSKTEPEKMIVNLDGLFNNNKELSDSMNLLINENWRDIWVELETGINNALSDIVKALMAKVLQTLSYDDFYKSD